MKSVKVDIQRAFCTLVLSWKYLIINANWTLLRSK